jgi:hypothetical protein
MPDLAAYDLHRTVEDAAFEGVTVPGLSAEFFRRCETLRHGWLFVTPMRNATTRWWNSSLSPVG